MTRYDIRIRREAFREGRGSAFKNFEQLNRKYRRERRRKLMLRIIYLGLIVGIGVLLFSIFNKP